MRSPTSALLWEIWRRNRGAVAVLAGLTVAGRLIDASERAAGSPETSSLVELLAMVSFVLVFGIFNYTESGDGRGVGHFPRRLFTLPVSSLLLVTVPAVAGIVSVELLYLLWLTPLSTGASASRWFVAILFAAAMTCYQAAFWTLEGLGPLRLVVAGGVAFAAFGASLLPSFPPSPPPAWRSEPGVAAIAAALSALIFLLEWRHIDRKRTGDETRATGRALFPWAGGWMPARRSPFASPSAAHFWFEWRCAGTALPMVVGGVLLAVMGPLSWFARDNPVASLRLLYGMFATPIILAIPIGMAFARPMFWGDELSMPPFVAVRPLTDEEIVLIRVKVAAASAAASWLLVLVFAGVWLSVWGNVDEVSRLAIQWWAFHSRSLVAVYGMAALMVIAGALLTWRFLVIRLWAGLSGNPVLFTASVLSVVIGVIAFMVFDGTQLPDWVLSDPGHMKIVAWMLSIAVIAKYWLAAYSWRRVSSRYARLALVVWAAGTVCFLMLAIQLWEVIRIYLALDVYRFQAVAILVALLAMPLARLGLVPSRLTRNRHR